MEGGIIFKFQYLLPFALNLIAGYVADEIKPSTSISLDVAYSLGDGGIKSLAFVVIN